MYGCGDRQIRDIQLDIKKWQVTEAERQRTVKLTSADWIDHPGKIKFHLIFNNFDITFELIDLNFHHHFSRSIFA